jgi:D-alanine-D-alanine ligase
MDRTGTIVFVANERKHPPKGYNKHMSTFALNKYFTNRFILKAIRSSGFKVIHYRSLTTFEKNIHLHKDDLVFPYYHGVASKIRQSYVQTICEIHNIQFVGPDAYAHTICNDKMLSKDICRHFGILSPTSKSFFNPIYLPDITTLKPPLIVKPQFEADSIGISKSNVFHSHAGVLELAEELNVELGQPILIEEYIEGKELSLSIIGYGTHIKELDMVEYVKKDGVYDYKRKMTVPQKYKNANYLLNDNVVSKVSELFSSLDKIEYLRMDFIFKEGKLYNIELTADPTLSPKSSFFLAFKKKYDYSEFINLIIDNCLERYRHNELN